MPSFRNIEKSSLGHQSIVVEDSVLYPKIVSLERGKRLIALGPKEITSSNFQVSF